MVKSKKFWVSLAVNVPHNWEIEVEAGNEREAFEKARNTFEDDSSQGELVEVPESDITLDLSDPDDPKDPWNPDGTSGVAIEERE
jgi:1,2-phenylacetyl-CoA epoxidase PaaB subunit